MEEKKNKKEKLKKKLKNKQGITLIALVITIVVLLILAGVSIAMLTGNNGILTQAQKAKTETEDSQINEKIDLSDLEDYIDKQTGSSFSKEKGVNIPKLTEDMIPVKMQGDSLVETTANDIEWYNYREQTEQIDGKTSEWANVKITKDGVDSYFVWIPRFEYKITPTTDTVISSTNTGTIEVKFIPTSQVTADEGYIIHPAFTNNVDNGGWDSELPGFWVGKYEPSRSDATNVYEGENSNIKIVPNVISYRNISIGDSYTVAFNYDRSKESHMMKNSEWGAVAYLTHSQYGRNGNQITINNSSTYITGNAGNNVDDEAKEGITNAYNTKEGELASTTGNITGIYDMSGGAYEKVATYNSFDSNGCLESSGWTAATGLNVESNSTKYATRYNNETENEHSEINSNIGILGDGTYEVYVNYFQGWFRDYIAIITAKYPFASRGGKYSDTSGSGIFYSSSYTGGAYEDSSFRVVLCP